MIDSDGSIQVRLDTYAMRVRKPDSAPVFKERVAVAQIEREAVDALHEAFGGSLFVSGPPPSKPNSLPLYHWQLVDRMAAEFLRAILPYLRIKRRQADRCLELRRLKELRRQARFAVGRGHRGGGRRPADLSLRMQAIRTEVMRLNHANSRERTSA